LEKGVEISKPTGKLGIMLVGLGAVSTTVIAGVEAAKLGLAKPFGSLTQMATIRLGKRTEKRTPLIKDFVPLADIGDLVFGAWDIFPDDAFVAASKAAVLDQALLKSLETPLRAIKPMKGAFEQRWVKRLTGTHVKVGRNKKDLADQIVADIRDFKSRTEASRLVMIWCGSTEAHTIVKPEHENITAFENALESTSPEIASSMLESLCFVHVR
jgi:myo-inositol-1-phosphate synthase